MQVVSFSEARENFKAVLDRVVADADVILISRRHTQDAVVMSLDTYNRVLDAHQLAEREGLSWFNAQCCFPRTSATGAASLEWRS